MDELNFHVDGRKVVKTMNGERKDYQVFGSPSIAEEWVEKESTLYSFRIPRVNISITSGQLPQ
ncbi:hypothetical protein [Vibrio phage CKB-S1]|nr:hypothetical protein [Vibrio phage CKB-S1]